jgi:competence protein ComEA
VNRRERAVVLLVVATLLVGVGISLYKRVRLARQVARNPIAVVQDSGLGQPKDSVAIPRPVDLNQATQRQLDVLPGIGPVLASRIVEYRQRNGGFRSVSELQAVSGIGSKRYAAMKDMVTVGPPRIQSPK